MTAPAIAKIAVAAATYWVDRAYSYRIPERLSGEAAVGKRVVVPFGNGNRRSEGIILALEEESGGERALKSVERILDEESVLGEKEIRLALWMRRRFFCTVFEAARAMLPAGLWYSLEAVYAVCEGIDRESAYDSAKGEGETLALDTVFAHGGSCPLKDLQAVFAPDDPARVLGALVKKGVLHTDSREKRRIGDQHRRLVTLAISAEEAQELAARKRSRSPRQAAVLELLSAWGSVSYSELSYFTGASSSVITALAKVGAVELGEQETFRRPDYEHAESRELPALNGEQQAALDALRRLRGEEKSGGALLYGVTGSGKTSVYIRLIAEELEKGRSSILLVPEISLTPQMLRTFSSYFGENIAVLHSSLSIGERYDEWKRVKKGLARVVIGTRSAVFAPCVDLGLIILDEEQEHTYKSENAPRYHARDVARYRCAQSGALLLLGSATPDVCSMYAALRGDMRLVTLSKRYNERALPPVQIVDMKQELKNGNGSGVSEALRRELAANLELGEQSILFLNRRGASHLVCCSECGYTCSCPNCSVSLTYHSDKKRLVCHYCGHTEPVRDACPECGGKLNFVGLGTQKLQEQLMELFPGVEILRMDADTVSPAGSHEAILGRFRSERIPILLGTQMVTKGLDFPNVTLVGVISADQALYAGSYRSSERCFSLITQVVGRSGRGEKPGRAVIQTYTPENQVIMQAARQDYRSFYTSEIALRRLQYAPPFSDTLAITATGLTEADVLRCCAYIRNMAVTELGEREDMLILGPAPLPVVRVNHRFRYRVTLNCRCDRAVREFVSGILVQCNSAKEYKGVSVFADMNPME